MSRPVNDSTAVPEPSSTIRFGRTPCWNNLKDHVVEYLGMGFTNDFEYNPAEPWGHVRNYNPLHELADAKNERSNRGSHDWWPWLDL